MEALPNEIVLTVFSYLKTYDIVYAFYLLQDRYARLIENFRPFATSIDLLNAPIPVFNFYHSLLLKSTLIDREKIENVKLECHMLRQLVISDNLFPRLQSLSIIVRKTDELRILRNYFPFFTKIKHLYLRSDVCCCDRVAFEENVKQNLFQTDHIQLQSLVFATPPCYSISLQDVQFKQCLFTNLTFTARSMNDFCSILGNAHHLRSLRIRILDTSINQRNPLTIATPPPQLEHLLFICLHSTSYDIIRNIFKTLVSLKKLSFSLVFDIQSSIIDGHRLRDDIFIHLPNLMNIQFEIKSLISMMSNDLIRSFETPFWSRFTPIGFHSYNHIYTLPFPFHHLDLDQSILRRQQTRKSNANWRFVRDIDVYDRTAYSNDFLIYLRDEFPRLTTLTLKSTFNLVTSSPALSTWFSLPTIHRLSIKSTPSQNPELIKQFLLCLPNCQTLDCDYVLVARATGYFRRGHLLSDFGKRLGLLLVDELPGDWKNDKKKKRCVYFHRFRRFFPNIECPLYD